MSTPICNPPKLRCGVFRAVLLAAALPLMGCDLPPGGETLLGFQTPPDEEEDARATVLKIPFYRGEVVVQGPPGYCIDPASVRRGGSGGAFALLASCESLSRQRGRKVAPVIMTVTALPRRAGQTVPSAGDLAKAMAPVKALRMEDRDGLSLVYLAQGGENAIPGGAPAYWRGGMVINGHLVGLAVYAPKRARVTDAKTRAIIVALAEALREASPARGVSGMPRSAPATTAAQRPATELTGFGALLGGLFPEQS